MGKKQCPINDRLSQNIKAPAKNGEYNSFTKETVTDIEILQRHIKRLRFGPVVLDGILGKNTDISIKNIQNFLNVEEDGLIGPNTRKLINNSCKDIEIKEKVKVVTKEEAIYYKNDINSDYLLKKIKNNRSLISQLSGVIGENKRETPITSIFGRIGIITSQLGDYTASQITNAFDISINTLDDILEGSTNLHFTTVYKTKLDAIEISATSDQADSEIEIAYNNIISIVSQTEAESGILTDVKR
jgi:hypothetical protein